VGFLAFLSLLAVEIGGADIVLLFSALGGLSGIAAVATVFVNHRANVKRARRDDKSVAIKELEKAVPGMGDIIKEWQNIVHHLQEELMASKVETAEVKRENAELRKENEQLHDKLEGQA
jgi:SMC interacting uncharacterized protein involved in chromosome segregation